MVFDGIYGIQVFWICMDPHWFCSTGFGSGSALAIWKGIHEIGRLKSFTLSVADPDPHNFGKLDLDPHHRGKLDPKPHQSEKQDPDLHQSEKVDGQIER
jgi:hypothetical protein